MVDEFKFFDDEEEPLGDDGANSPLSADSADTPLVAGGSLSESIPEDGLLAEPPWLNGVAPVLPGEVTGSDWELEALAAPVKAGGAEVDAPQAGRKASAPADREVPEGVFTDIQIGRLPMQHQPDSSADLAPVRVRVAVETDEERGEAAWREAIGVLRVALVELTCEIVGPDRQAAINREASRRACTWE